MTRGTEEEAAIVIQTPSHNGRGDHDQTTQAHSLQTECGEEGAGSQSGAQGN